jgi:hypothetical protein
MDPQCFVIHFQRVELFGNAAQNGWWIPSKAKYWRETDSEQVPWGKDEKHFGKRVKQYVNLLKGKRLKSVMLFGLSRSAVYIIEWGQHQFWPLEKGKRKVAPPGELIASRRIQWLGLRNAACLLAGIRPRTCLGCWHNGFKRPVLKHGPRSLTYLRVFGCQTRVRNESERRSDPQGAASTDLDL